MKTFKTSFACMIGLPNKSPELVKRCIVHEAHTVLFVSKETNERSSSVKGMTIVYNMEKR